MWEPRLPLTPWLLPAGWGPGASPSGRAPGPRVTPDLRCPLDGKDGEREGAPPTPPLPPPRHDGSREPETAGRSRTFTPRQCRRPPRPPRPRAVTHVRIHADAGPRPRPRTVVARTGGRQAAHLQQVGHVGLVLVEGAVLVLHLHRDDGASPAVLGRDGRPAGEPPGPGPGAAQSPDQTAARLRPGLGSRLRGPPAREAGLRAGPSPPAPHPPPPDPLTPITMETTRAGGGTGSTRKPRSARPGASAPSGPAPSRRLFLPCTHSSELPVGC